MPDSINALSENLKRKVRKQNWIKPYSWEVEVGTTTLTIIDDRYHQYWAKHIAQVLDLSKGRSCRTRQAPASSSTMDLVSNTDNYTEATTNVGSRSVEAVKWSFPRLILEKKTPLQVICHRQQHSPWSDSIIHLPPHNLPVWTHTECLLQFLYMSQRRYLSYRANLDPLVVTQHQELHARSVRPVLLLLKITTANY